MLPTRDCGCRSSLVFSVCLVSRHRHQWFRRRRPGARCSDHSFLARTRKGLGSGRDPTLRIPANTSSLPSASTADLLERTESWAGPGPGNGLKEEVMTNRAHQWKRRALFAMLLVLPGLSGCTSGMSASGEPPAASDVDVDPWPRQLVSGQPLTIALDRLQAELEVERVEDPSRIVQVKNDPPRIIVSQGRALLVRIDGQPVLREVAGTGLLRVINTRVLLLLDRSAGRYYLDTPAPELTQLLQTGAIPAIYVSNVPAELIALRGQPALAPIAATDILQVTNTDDDLFLYTPQQEYYVLLSGRRFRAAPLQGRWEYVASGLPGDFARIPESHPKGAVLASVPGTPQARQAVIANGIPQTATISRSGAELAVHYDGPPQLEPIEGTPLQYVVNASFPVIRVDPTSYYALQNGVWFAASSLNGSWAVATSVPPVIYTIPASSPLHYVTYAYVYGSTPNVVYTGYTPGYLGTVVAPGPIVVYGTGYVYPGWAGTFWYPWPVTWGWGPFDLGFGVDVFTGFAFGFAVGPYLGWHHGWGL